jgi:hypothetical protein
VEGVGSSLSLPNESKYTLDDETAYRRCGSRQGREGSLDKQCKMSENSRINCRHVEVGRRVEEALASWRWLRRARKGAGRASPRLCSSSAAEVKAAVISSDTSGKSRYVIRKENRETSKIQRGRQKKSRRKLRFTELPPSTATGSRNGRKGSTFNQIRTKRAQAS